MSRLPASAALAFHAQLDRLGTAHVAPKALVVKTDHEPSACGTRTNLLSRVSRALLVGTAALFLCLSVSDIARGDEVYKLDASYSHDSDGDGKDDTTVEIYQGKNGYAVLVWENGELVSVWHSDDLVSNPSPDDSSSGPKGDLRSLIALAKQKGSGKLFMDLDFWKTPLGQRLSAGGGGPAPVINPSDDEGSKGGSRNPSVGKEKLGAPEIFNKFDQAGSGKAAGFQFNSGSPADQLKTHGPHSSPGGGSGDGDDKGSHKPPPGSYFGPADLVDPLGPPVARGAAQETKNRTGNVAASVKKIGSVQGTKTPQTGKTNTTAVRVAGSSNKTGGGSNLFARGLLDTNGGFAGSGPAAAGTASRGLR